MSHHSRFRAEAGLWTVIIFNKRHKALGVWTGVNGRTADAAIRHCWIHNVPKADRLMVCEAVAYPQDRAELRHLRPELEMVIERSDGSPSDEGNVPASAEGSRLPQAGGEPAPENPPAHEWDETPLPPIQDAVFSLAGWLIDTGPHPEHVHGWFTTIASVLKPTRAAAVHMSRAPGQRAAGRARELACKTL